MPRVSKIIQSYDLGNTSASSTTVSMPSRASAEAVYEPPGPPPTTSVVHLVGIEFMFILVVIFFSFFQGELLAPVGWEKECQIAQESVGG